MDSRSWIQPSCRAATWPGRNPQKKNESRGGTFCPEAIPPASAPRVAKHLLTGNFEIEITRAKDLPRSSASSGGFTLHVGTFVEVRIVASPPSPESPVFDPSAQTVGPHKKTCLVRANGDPEYNSLVLMSMTDFDPDNLYLCLTVFEMSDQGEESPVGFISVHLTWITSELYRPHLPEVFALQPCHYLSCGPPREKLQSSKLFARLSFSSPTRSGNSESSPNPIRRMYRHQSQGVPHSVPDEGRQAFNYVSHVGTDTQGLCEQTVKDYSKGPTHSNTIVEHELEETGKDQYQYSDRNQHGESSISKETKRKSDSRNSNPFPQGQQSDNPKAPYKDEHTAHVVTVELMSAEDLPPPDLPGVTVTAFAEIRLLKPFKKLTRMVEAERLWEFFKEQDRNTLNGCFAETTEAPGSSVFLWNQTFHFPVLKKELQRLRVPNAGDLVLQIRIFDRMVTQGDQPIGDLAMSLRNLFARRNETRFRLKPAPFGSQRNGLASALLCSKFTIS